MNINGAVCNLVNTKQVLARCLFASELAALDIAIEALKRLQAYRKGITIAYEELLPGETKE